MFVIKQVVELPGVTIFPEVVGPQSELLTPKEVICPVGLPFVPMLLPGAAMKTVRGRLKPPEVAGGSIITLAKTGVVPPNGTLKLLTGDTVRPGAPIWNEWLNVAVVAPETAVMPIGSRAGIVTPGEACPADMQKLTIGYGGPMVS